MRTIGLLVNPAAGRDVRRLTGGASVVDDYAKRRVAECVLDGLTVAGDPLEVLVMPDRAGIADHAVAEAPVGVEAATLVAVSTGTNTVVPSAVDGTVAGAAAALVATGAVSTEAVTTRHGMIEARAETPTGERRLRGLAAAEVSAKSFVGTRALLDPADLRGGVVSRAHPGDIGLPAVAGTLESLTPEEPGGVALRLTDPEDAPRSVRAIVAPGVTATVGIESFERLEPHDSVAFDVPDGVVGADGERELELTDATVELSPVPTGPRLVDIDAALEMGIRNGGFDGADGSGIGGTRAD